MKRLILLGTLATLFLASAIWTSVRVLNSGQQEDSKNTVTTAGASGLPPQSLTHSAINSLITSPSGNAVRYYESQTGRAFEFNFINQKTVTLSDRKLSGFIRSIWSPDRQSVISVFSQAQGMQFTYFDYATRQSALLPLGITDIVFSPDGNNIACVVDRGDTRLIVTSRPDGTDSREMLKTRASEVALSWPTAERLVLASRSSGRAGTDLSILSQTGSLISILSQKENLEYAWSRDGSKLLYSYFEKSRGIQLWYYDATTQLSFALDVATSAQKCAWHRDGVIVTCGVPTNTLLSQDRTAIQSATRDDIVSINTTSGIQKIISKTDTQSYLSVIDPVISPLGDFFVFINIFDQHAYSVEL